MSLACASWDPEGFPQPGEGRITGCVPAAGGAPAGGGGPMTAGAPAGSSNTDSYVLCSAAVSTSPGALPGRAAGYHTRSGINRGPPPGGEPLGPVVVGERESLEAHGRPPGGRRWRDGGVRGGGREQR